ncbi:MAG TPA: selenocysteine-specific translation elongation factor [Longimicrobiales bacterium]|nr:selenocysteine-specific translation elongation factor [Longimicrobiales bacterium]
MSAIIGTGGHIDHGKTALVAALTGEDTDRLPEEKRRGISIDLGFSRIELDGATHGIVDVPGHEDFIRNMLAGATGLDVLLLVVAADEGVMPQTREHVAIADLLDVPRAVVALTKADLVEPEWLTLVREDVAALLAGTRFAGAPMVPVASPSGQGIDALRAELGRAVGTPRGAPGDLFRLPIDRVFTVRGTGTVVTGTVWSGALRRDEAVRVEPGGLSARVRGLQVHGADAERVEAGSRAAIALAGVERDQVARGVTLVTHPGWRPASMITVRLRILPDTGWSIRQRQRVRVHLATAEVMARVRLLEGTALRPGETAWAQLRLEDPLLARAGDRCVIRSYSPVTTIAGGVVAEPAAPKRKRLDPGLAQRLHARARASGEPAVSATVSDAGAAGIPVDDLPVESGATPDEIRSALEGDRVILAAGRAFPASAGVAATDALAAAVDAHHLRWPLRTGIELEELRRAASGAGSLVQWALDSMVAEGSLEARDGRIARAGWRPALDADQRRRVAALEALLQRAGATPPADEELAAAAGPGPDPMDELLRYMEAHRLAVRLQPGLYLAPAVVERLTGAVRERLGGRSGLGPADFRPIVDVSRKHLIPILEYLDLAGVTVRHGEGRSVPGRDAGA